MESSKRKAKKRKRAGIDFIGITMLVFVTYIVVNSVVSQSSGIRTTIIRSGTAEDKIEGDAFIFREQTVITAPKEGFIYCEVQDEERVKTGETVVSIYKNEISPEVSGELGEVERKIKKISSNVGLTDVYSNDEVRIEKDIAQTVQNIARENSLGKASGVEEQVDSINRLIEKKRTVSGAAKPEDTKAELEALEKEKAALKQKYGVDKVYVHSPKAGAFTSKIDNLEEQTGIDKIADITPQYIKELAKQKPKTAEESRVQSGSPIGKIVNNYSWSAAMLVGVDDISDLNVGDSVSLRFVNMEKETAAGTVSKITGEDGGKAVIVVTSNRYVSGIYSTSVAEAELIKNSYSGFKIPSESIRIKDGAKGVYVIRSGAARFIPIKISYSDENFSIVSAAEGESRTLKLYDELIVSGRNVYEGKEVK